MKHHYLLKDSSANKQIPDSFRPLCKVLLGLLKLPKAARWEGVNFLGNARSCGGIYCDPGLLRCSLGSGACGKCSEDKQAWLEKSSTLDSFDKDR